MVSIGFYASCRSSRSAQYRLVRWRYHHIRPEYAYILPADIMVFVFFGQNVSTIDHVLSAVESFEGVKSTDVSIPTSLLYHNDWVIKEINQRLSK
jgi:hypothetical protein